MHYPIALKAGIAKDIADAIADGRRPTGMSADEEIVYDFTDPSVANRSQETSECLTLKKYVKKLFYSEYDSNYETDSVTACPGMIGNFCHLRRRGGTSWTWIVGAGSITTS